MKFVSSKKSLWLGAALLTLAAPSRVLAAPRLAQADDENIIIDADHPDATLPPPVKSRATQKKASVKAAPAKPAPREYSQQYRAPDDGELPSAGALPQNAAPSFSASPTAPPVAPSSGFGSVAGVALIDGSDAKNLAILRAAFDARLNGKMVLWDGRNRWTTTRVQLGLSIPFETLMTEASRVKRDVPLRFSLDESRMRATLTQLAAKIEHGGALKNVAATEKIQVALPASMQRVARALQSDPPQDYAELVVTRAPISTPKSTTQVASKSGASASGIAAFPFVLASYSTPYNSAIRGRTNNLRMAAKLVNGYVVKPGATFSTNRAIGPRNAAAGWREAKMFINGQIVDGVGSGICQCSTTIYNAALLANLPIVERHPHTFRVTYAPASRDAAIYWGQKDMKFRNDTGGAIYVETKLRDGHFHVRLLGTQPNTTQVTVQSRVLARGNGTRSEAYRVVKTSGGTQRVRLSRDFYRPHP